MSGRRKKPCEFCMEDSSDVQDDRSGHQLYVEWYPDNGLLGITSFAQDECGEALELRADFQFEFCPMCGRRLL